MRLAIRRLSDFPTRRFPLVSTGGIYLFNSGAVHPEANPYLADLAAFGEETPAEWAREEGGGGFAPSPCRVSLRGEAPAIGPRNIEG